MRTKTRCAYLPKCNRPSVGLHGKTPICANCQALVRMEARDRAKTAVANALKWAAEKRAEGWTKQDAAASLKTMLESDNPDALDENLRGQLKADIVRDIESGFDIPEDAGREVRDQCQDQN